jgi:hypothetical protein
MSVHGAHGIVEGSQPLDVGGGVANRAAPPAKAECSREGDTAK